MNRLKVIFVEDISYGFSKNIIRKWKSKLFKVTVGSGMFKPGAMPDLLENYGYSDEKLRLYLVEKHGERDCESYDLKFFVVNVPLAEDCFSRIISKDTIVISYYDIKDILETEGLPLENYLLSSLYTYFFLYRNYAPFVEDGIVHQVSRGCIFDYCGNKREVIYSCNEPKICDNCKINLVERGVPIGEIIRANKEMKCLRRRKIDQLKRNPILYMIVFSILLPLLVSIIASIIYELL